MRKAHTVTLTKRVVVHNPNNLPTIHYSLLNDFQEDLKYITEENLEKLKQSILKHGIFVPKFVWLHDEKYFTIDGHQTVKALRSLESEGYFIPDIPIVEIDAANESDAAEKLLQINSQHGTFNVNTTFFEKKNLDLKIISGLIEIPELMLYTSDTFPLTKDAINLSSQAGVSVVDEIKLRVTNADITEVKMFMREQLFPAFPNSKFEFIVA